MPCFRTADSYCVRGQSLHKNHRSNYSESWRMYWMYLGETKLPWYLQVQAAVMHGSEQVLLLGQSVYNNAIYAHFNRNESLECSMAYSWIKEGVGYMTDSRIWRYLRKEIHSLFFLGYLWMHSPDGRSFKDGRMRW